MLSVTDSTPIHANNLNQLIAQTAQCLTTAEPENAGLLLRATRIESVQFIM